MNAARASDAVAAVAGSARATAGAEARFVPPSEKPAPAPSTSTPAPNAKRSGFPKNGASRTSHALLPGPSRSCRSKSRETARVRAARVSAATNAAAAGWNAVAIAANGSGGDASAPRARRRVSASRAFSSPEPGTAARSHSVSRTSRASASRGVRGVGGVSESATNADSDAVTPLPTFANPPARWNATLMSCVVAVLAAARVSGDETETHTRSNAESASARDSPSSRRCSETAQARSAPTAATAYVCAEPLEAPPEREDPSGIADAHAQSASTNARHDPSAASSKSVFTSSRGGGFVRRVASSFASFVASAFAVRFSPSRSVVASSSFASFRVVRDSRTRGPPLTFVFVVPTRKPPAMSLCAAPSAGSASAGLPESQAAASARVAESANRRVLFVVSRRAFVVPSRSLRSYVNLLESEPRTSRASVTSLPPLSGVILAFGSTATSSSTSRRNRRHASFSGFTLWNVQGASFKIFSTEDRTNVRSTSSAPPFAAGVDGDGRAAAGVCAAGACGAGGAPASPAPASPGGVPSETAIASLHEARSRAGPRVSRSGGPRDGRSVAAAGVPPRLPRVRTRVRV